MTATVAPIRIRRQAVVLLFFAVAFALLAGYAVDRIAFSYRPLVTPIQLQGKWIRTPGVLDYGGCFRKTFHLSGHPQNAWLMISAQDAFEVIVNGNTVDRLFLWRPTRQFHNGLSESGQRLVRSLPLLSLNYPREYQWKSHRSHAIPIYMDLTPFLRPGINTLCVMLETRKAPARFNLYGQILHATGTRDTIVSDETWKADATPKYSGLIDWTKVHYDDESWANAVVTDAPPGGFVRLLDPDLYARPFAGRWLQAPAPAAGRDVWFEADWPLDARPRDAWLRMVSNRSYDLFINGRRVNSENRGAAALDAGNWIIGTQRAMDTATAAELLDPDEIGSLEENNRFLTPPHTDPTANDFHAYEDVSNRTRDHPFAAGPDGPDEKPQRNSGQPPPLSVYSPTERLPNPLKRDRSMVEFNGYSVAALLGAGVNHIRIRLLPSDAVPPLAWAPQLALDAGVTFADGSRASLASGPRWRTVVPGTGGRVDETADAVAGNLARTMGFSLPPLQYRGFVYNQDDKVLWWTLGVAVSLLGSVGSVAGTLWRHAPTRRVLLARTPIPLDEATPARLFLARCTEVVLLPTTILGSAALVQAAWGERLETLWFYSGTTWAVLLAAAVAVMAMSGYRLFFSPRDALSATAVRVEFFFERLPASFAWKLILCWLLLLCFFLSAYGLDFHPIDDDEYASIEASVAIARTGVPQYSQDVWYTRSPAYHYLAGAIIKVFGENLWAMRLPGVFFGVATAWLTYHCGRRLLNSPWVGMGALCLYVVHPFMIYSAHIARFYQQQQFFALLTVYCFCRGFVMEQSMRFRYATLASFLCCVLSQELSLVLGFQLAVGYFLFAEKKPWRDEIRLLVVAGCALAIIATDLVVFQTRCLTHTEGVSPSVEATLHPQFANPLNFLSVFFAYSRLHLALSILFVFGLPFAFKNKNRYLLAIYFVVFSGALFANILVTGDSLRYQYWLIPMWLLLAVYGPQAMMAYLEEAMSPEGSPRGGSRHGWIKPALGATMFSAAFLSLSPWHILDAYDAKLLGDSTGAFQFVRTNLRPGDKVAATEPHPHGALMETGRSDYDVSFPRLYDFIYLKHGRLIDRNAGAESVSSVDELQDLLAENDRVWIVVNREKFRSRGQNIRWEYPGARAELFLRRNCRIEYQGYLWTVFLWDVRNGSYHGFRSHLTQ